MCFCVCLAYMKQAGGDDRSKYCVCTWTFMYTFTHLYMCLCMFGVISHYHGAVKIPNRSWLLCDIYLAAIENVPNSQGNSEVFLKSNIAVCCNKLNISHFFFWMGLLAQTL